MAEGLFRKAVGDRLDVFSAGTRPSTVRPEAIVVMSEIGIDIARHRAKSVEEFAGQEFRYVVTVCDHARDSCPVFAGNAERVHWSLEDPAAFQGNQREREAEFRRIRDQLAGRIEEFRTTLRIKEGQHERAQGS